MNHDAANTPEPDSRATQAQAITRTAADYLRARGWRHHESSWVPAAHDFSMYQAAMIQKTLDNPNHDLTEKLA